MNCGMLPSLKIERERLANPTPTEVFRLKRGKPNVYERFCQKDWGSRVWLNVHFRITNGEETGVTAYYDGKRGERNTGDVFCELHSAATLKKYPIQPGTT